MWAGHARPAGSWFITPAAHEPPVCTDTVIDVMSSGDPPGGCARRGHAYLGNGFVLCELMSARHDGVGGSCRAQVCTHNSKPFPRYACIGLAPPPGGSPDDITSITVSVQTGGPCAAGVINHEPAGRA